MSSPVYRCVFPFQDSSAPGPGCVKTRTLFFKVEFWPRLGGNSSQEIFRHHREGTTKEKDSQQVSRRSVFTQPGSFTSLRRCPPVGCFTPLNEHDLRQLSRPICRCLRHPQYKPIFKLELCPPMASGLLNGGSGDFGTSPFLGSSSDKSLLPTICRSGVPEPKHNGASTN